jgi:hypothetical protein
MPSGLKAPGPLTYSLHPVDPLTRREVPDRSTHLVIEQQSLSE